MNPSAKEAGYERERDCDGWTEIEVKTMSGGETEACQEEDD